MYNYNKTPGVFALDQPKAAVMVIVAVLLVVLLGCVALAVDIGYLYVARTELQRTADAAALAGAQALARSLDNPVGPYTPSAQTICSQVGLYARLNAVLREGITIDGASDVRIGYLSTPHNLNTPLQIVPLNQCNAVQVTARRDSSSSNGRIGLFFGPIFGIDSSAVGASATAVLDDRFSAYAPSPMGGTPAIPIAIDTDFWKDQIVNGNGPDLHSYDPNSGTVQESGDGVPEITLFPAKLGPSTEEAGDEGAGNFGLLHVGSGSLGTSAISEQITNGISAEDFIDLTGEPMIKFYTETSEGPVTYNVVTYDILGDPGIKTSLKSALQAQIGKVVGFFLYDTVSEEGANTVFNISGMRFGRVVEVDLTGGDKIFAIQPVPYYGPDIITSPGAPSTDWLIGSLQLVR